MGSSIAFAAASAALAVQSSAPSQPTSFEPAGPWTVEVSEGICLVGRTYGSGSLQLTVGFRQAPNADDFQIGLWISDPSQKGSRGMAQLRLDQLAPIEAGYKRGPVAIKGMQLIWIDTKRPELAALPMAKQLEIAAGSFQAKFGLRNVEGALKALEDCERDLLVSWGMDRAILASIASPPRADISSFFGVRDYPRDAIAMRKQGTAGIRFWVSTDGTIGDCKVVASSGTSLLDARSCALLTRRGKFEPARTKDGVPVRSISFARIRWEIAR